MRLTGMEVLPTMQRFGAEKAFNLMREAGFEGCDFDYMSQNYYYRNGADAFVKEAAENVALARKAGLTIYQCHGPWQHPIKDYTEEQRAERFEKMSLCLNVCRENGIPIMVIHPIMPFSDGHDGDYEVFKQINYDFYSRLLEVAIKCDVKIAYENMPFNHLTMSSPEETLAFVNRLNDDHFGFCLDTGHAHCLHFDVAKAVKDAGDKLIALHVHDNDGATANDAHLIPYRGTIDWEAFKSALKESPSDCAVSLETSVRDTCPEDITLNYLKSLSMIAHYLGE
ncbi:MAG: sugar phosphate isomerase/epimerase [Oscillospiraceae bacterium]|nr:sugar phosphate isomerase/epimerase [Candidatus Equicaccousia limihippi]